VKNSIINQQKIKGIKNKKVEINFTGEYVTSNAGAILLRQVEEKNGFLKRTAECIKDNRHQSYIDHDTETMLKQRVFALALGYEDVTDHNTLRIDKMLKIALNKDPELDIDLASGSTLSRFENNIAKSDLIRISKELVEEFIRSYKHTPKKLILDFDATDTRIHGNQENKFYHGYYRQYCFLPLYVFCGEKLLVSYLKAANKDAASGSWFILSLLVKRFRQKWPKVKITFRGDGGFCKHRMMDWCEKNKVKYIIGLSGNARLKKIAESIIQESENKYDETKEKVRLFGEIKYAAKTWSKERRVIVKAERLILGTNIRFVVTNITKHKAEHLYDKIYTARGEMENRIKEQQLYLFADQVSCHFFIANAFRMMLSSLAYVMLEKIRSIGLNSTKLLKSQCSTIRNKILKIGAIIKTNTRRIQINMTEAYPFQDIFWEVIKKFQ
jgi:hypothetical protein